MLQLYVLCVWLHLVAMGTWVGGMVFLALVVLPVLRRGGPRAVGEFMSKAAPRLRAVGWVCLAILGITGWAQLGFRGMAWNANGVILTKVLVYIVIVALSLLHDFWIGPKASAAMRADPEASIAKRWRRVALSMGRLTALLALIAVFLGVIIVRGTPW